MKKILLTLLFALPLAFISCSKEKNDNDILAGTCWYNEKESAAYEFQRICFGTNRASYSYQIVGGKYTSWELKYTYKEPNIVIVYEDGSRFGKGYINGGKLYITDGFDSGTYIEKD